MGGFYWSRGVVVVWSLVERYAYLHCKYYLYLYYFTHNKSIGVPLELTRIGPLRFRNVQTILHRSAPPWTSFNSSCSVLHAVYYCSNVRGESRSCELETVFYNKVSTYNIKGFANNSKYENDDKFFNFFLTIQVAEYE